MARITLRLPEDVHRRLHLASERVGSSLNQVIVATLEDALARAEVADQQGDSLMKRVEQARRALGDMAVGLDLQDFPSHLRPAEDLPDTDELRQSMPELVPPLSATIVSDREDRV